MENDECGTPEIRAVGRGTSVHWAVGLIESCGDGHVNVSRETPAAFRQRRCARLRR